MMMMTTAWLHSGGRKGICRFAQDGREGQQQRQRRQDDDEFSEPLDQIIRLAAVVAGYAPTNMPNVSEMNTTVKATNSDKRPAISRRKKTSRPNSSVPIRCSADGEALTLRRS